ncbi:uncharacterized protein LOC141664443 isoform X4 [Apium graveolens]|uniref:uncharacterized protein LOC141664443 isoform X4 n=1 Tax=Apium graveolens TaxID=4045 RepID=UPI003D78C18D
MSRRLRAYGRVRESLRCPRSEDEIARRRNFCTKKSAQSVEVAKEAITRYIDTVQNQLAETCRALQDDNLKKKRRGLERGNRKP